MLSCQRISYLLGLSGHDIVIFFQPFIILLIVKTSFAIQASRPKPWFLIVSLPKGGQKPELYPRPLDLHQMSPILLQTPLVS